MYGSGGAWACMNRHRCTAACCHAEAGQKGLGPALGQLDPTQRTVEGRDSVMCVGTCACRGCPRPGGWAHAVRRAGQRLGPQAGTVAVLPYAEEAHHHGRSAGNLGLVGGLAPREWRVH